MNMKSVNMVTLKYTFPAIVTSIWILIIVTLIFIKQSDIYILVFIFNYSITPIIINVGFLIKENMYTFPIVKEVYSSFVKWWTQIFNTNTNTVYPVNE